MREQVTTCKACGAAIIWIRTRAGRSMPCNADAKNYIVKPGGSAKIVTPGGDVISAEIIRNPSEASGWGYTPHWSTCPAADNFKRKGGKS